MFHIRALYHTKTKSVLSSFVENPLHVSTPLGHLQGEHFRYSRVALIQLSENVPLTSHSVESSHFSSRTQTLFALRLYHVAVSV
jgi:hypothetical protein